MLETTPICEMIPNLKICACYVIIFKCKLDGALILQYSCTKNWKLRGTLDNKLVYLKKILYEVDIFK